MSVSDWLNSVPGVRASDQFIAADRRLFEDMIKRVIAAHAKPSEPDCYDAGLLGDGGGGDVDWWQDYIRAELGRAHEFYADQFTTPSQGLDAATVEREGDLPWSDLKVAFGVEAEADAIFARFETPTEYDRDLPSGWCLDETDGAGARMVVVFRVDHSPTVEEGRAVEAILEALATEPHQHGGKGA